MFKILQKRNGFVALVTVLVLGAISVLIAVTIVLISTDSISATAALEQSRRAKGLADSCAEIAVNKLKTDSTYTGNETVTFLTDSCEISAITGSGNTNRIVSTQGRVRNVIRKVEVSISVINPTTTILYWREIP